MDTRARLAVLISGRGSNLRALVQAIDDGQLNAELVQVVSSKPGTGGAQFARERGIAVVELDAKQCPDREAFDAQLDAALAVQRPDFYALAGFMRILTPAFITPKLGRIVNIHPSLLPKYPGLHPHARALAAGEREHGASVHFVTSELDAGPVLAQVRCAIAANDTETSLADRVLRLEHKLYPRALELLLSGTVGWSNSAATYHGRPLLNPLDLAALPIG